MSDLIHWFDLLGVMVFAISGTLIAHKKHLDGFGVIVLAAVTGIGGGTLRDIILGQEVFWLHDTDYFIAIFSAILISIIFLNQKKQIPNKLLQIADAFGLALFAIMGTHKALLIGMPAMTAVIMGVLTGCFGGLIRDVLAGEIPLLLKGQLYAITCILGGSVYTQMMLLNIAVEVAMLTGMLITLVVRLLAMRYNLIIHVFKY